MGTSYLLGIRRFGGLCCHPWDLVKVVKVWRGWDGPFKSNGCWGRYFLGVAKLGLPEKGRGENFGPVVVSEAMAGLGWKEHGRIQGAELIFDVKG